MYEQGGHGGEHEWVQRYWGWPLPPPGPFTLALEWRAASIALTTHELDGQVIIDAAARSQVVFAEPRASDSSATLGTIVLREVDD